MAPRKPEPGRSLSDLRPEVAAMWHPSKNGSNTPEDFREFSMFVAWWVGECGHEWESTIAHRSNGRGCPVCLGRVVVEGVNDLATSHPEVAAQWHPTKNGDLRPSQVGKGSDRKVWWSDHGHEWQTTISSRTSGGQGCAVCRGLAVQVGVNDLATTHPEIASEWHPRKNGDLTPFDVTAAGHRKFWWIGKCGHEWFARRGNASRGRGCPVCRGLVIVEGVNDLASQYPEVAAEWDSEKNGDLLPTQVTVSTAKKVWWKCESGHSWRTSVNARDYGSHGCPECAEFGFSPASDAWVYLIRHDALGMEQIGISNEIEARLASHAKRGWEVVEIRGPLPGDHVQKLERDGLKALRKRGARLGDRGGHETFSGFTEAWPVLSLHLPSLSDLMEWIRADE
jgi:hypothetical protein